MLKVLTSEYREGDQAVKTTVVTFLCIPIFKYKKSSTNNQIVRMLTVVDKPNKKISGFV